MIVLGVPVLAGAMLLVVAGLEHVRAPTLLARAAGTGIRRPEPSRSSNA